MATTLATGQQVKHGKSVPHNDSISLSLEGIWKTVISK